jgi:hypothetical protein
LAAALFHVWAATAAQVAGELVKSGLQTSGFGLGAAQLQLEELRLLAVVEAAAVVAVPGTLFSLVLVAVAAAQVVGCCISQQNESGLSAQLESQLTAEPVVAEEPQLTLTLVAVAAVKVALVVLP